MSFKVPKKYLNRFNRRVKSICERGRHTRDDVIEALEQCYDDIVLNTPLLPPKWKHHNTERAPNNIVVKISYRAYVFGEPFLLIYFPQKNNHVRCIPMKA